MPAAPEVGIESSHTLFGAVEHAKYTLRFADVLVAVETHDFPAVAAALFSSDTILDQTRRGVLEDMHARQLDSQARVLDGMPALDFSYQVSGSPPRIERALAVLVGSRIYLVTGMAEQEPGRHPEIRRFFESFRFFEEDVERAGGPSARAPGSRPSPAAGAAMR